MHNVSYEPLLHVVQHATPLSLLLERPHYLLYNIRYTVYGAPLFLLIISIGVGVRVESGLAYGSHMQGFA